MKKKRIYIAGPMTGYPNCNREAFNQAADTLKRNGCVVLNPATLPDGLTQAQYMDICFAMVRCCDEIHLLPNWRESAGAQAEYHYAKKLGLILLDISLFCKESGVVEELV